MKKLVKVLGIALVAVFVSTGVDAKSDYIERDSKGRIIKKIEYYNNGNRKEVEKYQYFKDAKYGNEPKIEWEYNYHIDGYKTKYEKVINTVFWDKYDKEWDTEEVYEKDITYYKNGNKKTNSIKKYGKKTHRIYYKSYTKYNDKEVKQNKSITKYVKGKKDNRKYYDYNVNGKLKSTSKSKAYRIEYFYKKGNLYKSIKRYYDSKGNLLKGKTKYYENKAVTIDEAEKIALKRTDGGSVVDRDVDYDDGRKVYEFEIIKGQYEYEVDVLASSGKIIKFEKEYND